MMSYTMRKQRGDFLKKRALSVCFLSIALVCASNAMDDEPDPSKTLTAQTYCLQTTEVPPQPIEVSPQPKEKRITRTKRSKGITFRPSLNFNKSEVIRVKK
jgi:hypothetical protein